MFNNVSEDLKKEIGTPLYTIIVSHNSVVGGLYLLLLHVMCYMYVQCET